MDYRLRRYGRPRIIMDGSSVLGSSLRDRDVGVWTYQWFLGPRSCRSPSVSDRHRMLLMQAGTGGRRINVHGSQNVPFASSSHRSKHYKQGSKVQEFSGHSDISVHEDNNASGDT